MWGRFGRLGDPVTLLGDRRAQRVVSPATPQQDLCLNPALRYRSVISPEWIYEMPHRFLPLVGCLLLPACATIVDGSSQSVTVSTDPPGASCKLMRGGETLGAIAMTPGSVQISKSKNDMTVECVKPGYQTATIAKSPTFGGATFGNIIAGGVVGAVVDAASGANYTYPSEVHVAMYTATPAPAPAVFPVGPSPTLASNATVATAPEVDIARK